MRRRRVRALPAARIHSPHESRPVSYLSMALDEEPEKGRTSQSREIPPPFAAGRKQPDAELFRIRRPRHRPPARLRRSNALLHLVQLAPIPEPHPHPDPDRARQRRPVHARTGYPRSRRAVTFHRTRPAPPRWAGRFSRRTPALEPPLLAGRTNSCLATTANVVAWPG